MRPTTVSRPSILTLRARASRTRSSLLLATRRTKNCIGYVSSEHGLQHADQVEKPTEQQITAEQIHRDQEHEHDDDLGRSDQFFSRGPVDLLHLAVCGNEEIN